MTFLLAHWQKLAVPLIALALGVFVWRDGYGSASTKYQTRIDTMVAEAEAAKAEALRQAREQTLLLEAVEANQRVLALGRKSELQNFSGTVVDEVKEHAQNSGVPECTFSAGFVRIHTDATRGPGMPAPPRTGPRDDAARTAVTEHTILSVDTANALLYHECARKLDYWIGRERAMER